ncbi:MAG: nucleotidyltransferase family protein [Bacteroidota bacterium]|nr:nucleotidyltransferase family protein [Bacteroidota bacterium]
MQSSKKSNGKSRRVSYKHYARIINKHKRDLYDRYKIKEIGIFGPVVRGEQKKQSDIDILVEFDETPGLLRFIQIDLVHKKALKHQLRDIILNEVIYV